MSRDVYFARDVRAHILAGVVLVIRCARRQGGDPQYIAGVLALAEHNALSVGLDWPEVLDLARAELGTDLGQLIDV